jgi:hypothetical protein
MHTCLLRPEKEEFEGVLEMKKVGVDGFQREGAIEGGRG